MMKKPLIIYWKNVLEKYCLPTLQKTINFVQEMEEWVEETGVYPDVLLQKFERHMSSLFTSEVMVPRVYERGKGRFNLKPHVSFYPENTNPSYHASSENPYYWLLNCLTNEVSMLERQEGASGRVGN